MNHARQRKEDLPKACAVTALLAVVAVVLFYSQYLELRRTLAESLSRRATAAAGQKVEIADISLNGWVIDLSGITVHNPPGFAPGNLLQIRRISVRPNFRDILKGKLHITDIAVYSPRLSIRKDRQGRWNISEKLIGLFSGKRKSALRYRIDEVRIQSGTFSFNGNGPPGNMDIEAGLAGLSSEKETKTTVEGKIFLAGDAIEVKASAYLNDEPKRFQLTFTSKGFSISAFRNLLTRYKLDPEKTKIDFSVIAEGDTSKGFALLSDITIQEVTLPFFRHAAGDIRLLANAFFSVKDRRLLVRGASLRAGRGSLISLRGQIDDLWKTPRYNARVSASRIELSDFRFIKDVMLGGTISSDGMEVKGTMGKGLPEVAGSAVASDVYVQSDKIDARKINGRMTFASGRGLSFEARTSADVSRAGAFMPDKPAHLKLTLSASKKRSMISFSSSASASAFEMGTDKRKFHAGVLSLNTTGRLEKKKLSCKVTMEAKDLRYAGRSISFLGARTSLEADGHLFSMRKLRIAADGLTANAAFVQLAKEGGGGMYEISATGLDAAYPEEKAAVEGLDFSLELRQKQQLSGDIVLSAGKVLYGGVEAGGVSGKGSFDEKRFRIELPHADIFNGKIHMTAEGLISGNHFPLSLTVAADGADLAGLSMAVSGFLHIPYTFSGRLTHASFEGTMAAPTDIRGRASLGCSGVSVTEKSGKKTLVRDVSADAGITFAGEGLSFGLRGKAGTVAADVAGEVKHFAGKARSLVIKIDLPEVKASAIRDSFWDIFPDSFLYTGLDGSLSSHLEVKKDKDLFRTDGNITLKDFTITGENDEYSLGPVNGTIPLGYRRPGGEQRGVSLPTFDQADFEKLEKIYSGKTLEKGFNRITLGSFRYGFTLLKDITLTVKQRGGVYTIDRLGANIFGGRLYGSAVITSPGGLHYRGGVLVEGLSLKKMCEEIEPIRGYISGRVDGVLAFKGSGSGLSGLIGKGDFWTYSSGGEKMKISKKLLRRLAGPSLKSYVGDRSFDKGVMSFYLDKGFLVFRQLEISNRNFFGMTDLSVKVAPLSNRIAVDQLMWSIAEAAQRAQKK